MTGSPKPDRSRFSLKGEVAFPLRLRKEFKIEEGRRPQFHSSLQGNLNKPIVPQFIRDLRGTLKGKGVMSAMMEDRKREREL